MHPPDGDACLMMTETSACIAAHAARPELAVVRAALPLHRPTIIGRPEFFVRYGEKEREAVASFDFLDELSTTSSSLSCSLDEPIPEDEEDTAASEVSRQNKDRVGDGKDQNLLLLDDRQVLKNGIHQSRDEVCARIMRIKVSQV